MMKRPNPRFAGYRHFAEIISSAVWLYFRFPPSLRMVEEMLATRGITVSFVNSNVGGNSSDDVRPDAVWETPQLRLV